MLSAERDTHTHTAHYCSSFSAHIHINSRRRRLLVHHHHHHHHHHLLLTVNASVGVWEEEERDNPLANQLAVARPRRIAPTVSCTTSANRKLNQSIHSLTHQLSHDSPSVSVCHKSDPLTIAICRTQGKGYQIGLHVVCIEVRRCIAGDDICASGRDSALQKLIDFL